MITWLFAASYLDFAHCVIKKCQVMAWFK